jgi:hypothetical protein
MLTFASPAPESTFADAIGRARAARDRAASLRTPSEADFASASDESIASALQAWASARRDATQDAHRAYADALRLAGDPAEEAAAYGEIAELWLHLEEDTRSALFAATPTPYRDDPSLVGAVQGATVYALRPILERVESNLGACQRLAQEAPAAKDACAAIAARYARSSDPWMSARPERAEPAIAPVAMPAAREAVPTTHPTPCTFAGTLLARGAVYDSPSGSNILLALDSGAAIDVDSLAVAVAPGGRYKVTVRWPRAVEGYLETKDAPFVLTRRVDIGADVVWATEGDRVSASEARGPTVRVERASGGEGAPDRRLFCHDLALATH